jgi:hypothetical protein
VPIGSKRKDQAIAARDRALAVLSAHGTMEKIARIPGGAFKNEFFQMFLRTPFQSVHGTEKNLPYGLDIWLLQGGKVLNIEWSDAGAIEVISYKPGEWENELRRIAE